ncbi:hypothetical protein RND71_031862 [Anisodus tanguticus]|uniref:Uncharacterized protein n=1 Tax=Anisodus tanguticus TaxID=243964 RepID=A0AAE1RE33_9SOLA|nr:hypothetical protein RND71_031862 [Anisodus tanguticus]
MFEPKSLLLEPEFKVNQIKKSNPKTQSRQSPRCYLAAISQRRYILCPLISHFLVLLVTACNWVLEKNVNGPNNINKKKAIQFYDKHMYSQEELDDIRVEWGLHFSKILVETEVGKLNADE